MPRQKLEITATEEQLDLLYKALMAGTPINLSLQYSGISVSTYYYWVALACVVKTAKSQHELEEIEKLARSGVSIQEIKEIAEATKNQKKSGVDAFIEPTEESLLNYKNNRRFRKFADSCHEIISKCDRIRSEVVISSMATIRQSTKDRRNNPSGAMWILERTFSDYFSKPTEKKEAGIDEKPLVETVKVEWIDPQTDEQKKRIDNIETEILRGFGEKA